jgi:hypothetical protein
MKRCKERKARHLKRKIQNINAMTAMSENKTNAIKSIASVGKKLTIVPKLRLMPKQSLSFIFTDKKVEISTVH